MIRKFEKEDLDDVSNIWLKTNIEAHPFVEESYWKSNLPFVKGMFVEAELYVYLKNENIIGFVGLDDTYIAGIFVSKEGQSQGVGKALLNYVKEIKQSLSLSVYKKNERAVSFYKKQGFIITEKSIEEDTQEIEYSMVWTN